ncbi:MAG: DUF4382 domain-containing protein [Candidatus Eiseniibacteriota bacterium]|jgi:hypothetical protein
MNTQRHAATTRGTLVPCVALVVLVAFFTGCGESSDPTAPLALDGDGTSVGLLAVSMTAGALSGDGVAEQPIASEPAPESESAAGPGCWWSDAPALAELVFEFDAIRIYATADCDSSGEHWRRASSDSCRYLEFTFDAVTVDAADLGTTLTDLLAGLEVPAGDYTHLAIHLADAWGTVDSTGATVPVALPGASDGFLKIQVPFTVEAGSVTQIVITIDLERSVREVPPGSGTFELVPVLRGDVWGPGPGEHEQSGGPHHGDEQGGGHPQGGGGGTGDPQQGGGTPGGCHG